MWYSSQFEKNAWCCKFASTEWAVSTRLATSCKWNQEKIYSNQRCTFSFSSHLLSLLKRRSKLSKKLLTARQISAHVKCWSTSCNWCLDFNENSLQIAHPFIEGCLTKQPKLITICLTAIQRMITNKVLNEVSSGSLVEALHVLTDAEVEELKVLQTTILLVTASPVISDTALAQVSFWKSWFSHDVRLQTTFLLLYRLWLSACVCIRGKRVPLLTLQLRLSGNVSVRFLTEFTGITLPWSPLLK